MTGFTLFETAIGTCAVAWSDAGLCRVSLPGRTAAQVRSAMASQFGADAEQAPPAEVGRAVAAIVRLLAGEPVDLSEIELDPEGVPDFNRQVYAVTRTIAPGRTLTYGEVASRLGQPGAARAVGRALGDNPYPIVVPCHRVLAAGGALHGFSAYGGLATKRRMLQIEGALAPDEPTLF